MNILVIGHSYVVDSNRQFWNQVASNKDIKVDIVIPKIWNSNLIKTLSYDYNPKTDSCFNEIFAVDCYFKGKASLYFFNWLAIFRILFNKKYDLVFVFQETWALSVAQISFLKILSPNRKSLYYLAVCQNIVKPKLSWVIPWEKLITKKIDRILYCTSEILDVLKWKKINTEVSFFPFTYDQKIYDFKFKKQNKELIIGYMGRLTEEKGINCLIAACKQLIEEGLKIKLLLAGNGPLKGQAGEAFVEYVGPFKHAEAHLFYQQINLFVLPSETRGFWKEQFGRVLIESIASGTPVIGSSSGAIPQVLASMGLDYIFQEGDAMDLTRVIKKISVEFETADFEKKMIKANDLNFQNYSHEKAGNNLLEQIKKDFSSRLNS